jgi:predicted alpha/beta-fold hydrolase
VFRLNLRDHGPRLHVVTQGLNRGVFLGTLLDETVCAVQRVAELAGDKAVYVVGPSMGGNFALRVAAAHSACPIHNLRKVVAISPAINPGRSTDLIDSHPILHRYFRGRWLRSLLIKEQLYPDLYQFAPLRRIYAVREMTEWLVRGYTEYGSADTYFAEYAVLGSALAGLCVSTTIITAANDEVIPVADFYGLAPSPYLQIQIHPTGGHVGFLDLSPLRHCLPEMVLAELAADTALAE